MLRPIIAHTAGKIKRATEPLKETTPKEAIEALARCRVEACSEYHGRIVASPYHPFAAAMQVAYSRHQPLVLSPDMFWLLISQGFARHVNDNAEELRKRFVSHDDKEELVVRRDDFCKGSPENPWSDVFGEFSTQIGQHIGERNHSLLVASFSTTGAIERAANEIVLMDSMKSYFEYRMHSLCGIPEVTLEGTPDDWQQLYERTKSLGSAYDLAWWTDRIQTTLERIAQSTAGTRDPELWDGMYKRVGGSGGPYITGWIIDFFPYLQRVNYEEPVQREGEDREAMMSRVLNSKEVREVRNWTFSDTASQLTTEVLPGSLCKAPFTWQFLHGSYAMEFLAGFIGMTQRADTLAVRPKIGWAVREVTPRDHRQQ